MHEINKLDNPMFLFFHFRLYRYLLITSHFLTIIFIISSSYLGYLGYLLVLSSYLQLGYTFGLIFFIRYYLINTLRLLISAIMWYQ